jgi:hypothetical protein
MGEPGLFFEHTSSGDQQHKKRPDFKDLQGIGFFYASSLANAAPESQ